MIKLIVFRAEHAMTFSNLSFRQLYDMERNGIAYSAVDEDKVIGCAGILIPWPKFGIAWTVFSHDILRHNFLLLRTVKRIIHEVREGVGLNRIEMAVDITKPIDKEYAEWLGFNIESPSGARRYTPDDKTAQRYEWVREP